MREIVGAAAVVVRLGLRVRHTLGEAAGLAVPETHATPFSAALRQTIDALGRRRGKP